jgi:hypothetical protein
MEIIDAEERSLRGVGDPTSALEALTQPLSSLSHTTPPARTRDRIDLAPCGLPVRMSGGAERTVLRCSGKVECRGQSVATIRLAMSLMSAAGR